jgi:hypothetical protein
LTPCDYINIPHPGPHGSAYEQLRLSVPQRSLLLHSGRDHPSRFARRRSALPNAANIEVMKVKAAKYFSKFDYRHGRA